MTRAHSVASASMREVTIRALVAAAAIGTVGVSGTEEASACLRPFQVQGGIFEPGQGVEHVIVLCDRKRHVFGLDEGIDEIDCRFVVEGPVSAWRQVDAVLLKDGQETLNAVLF